MTEALTKPLIVPQYTAGLIDLYEPDKVTGLPFLNLGFTIDAQKILNRLFPGRVASPNVCTLFGADLFVALSSSTSQVVLKLPGYLADPQGSAQNAFCFTLDAQDSYLGMAVNGGKLYVAEGVGGGLNTIVCYGGANVAAPGANGPSGDNYASRTVIGNAGASSLFANLVFDAAGNLWATDAQNNRIVAFDAVGLGNGTNTFHVLPSIGGPIAVANTAAGLTGPSSQLFNEPEGIDTDTNDGTANLWVANNNDNAVLPLTTLVKITPALQKLVLAANGTLTAAQIVPNVNCFIYQFADGAGGRLQFGGVQVDKAAQRLYVNEEQNHSGRAYALPAIAATPNAASAGLLAITTTNPGNGGMAMAGLAGYIKDSGTDAGFEPDTNAPAIWESPSISITQDSVNPVPGTLPATTDLLGGTACSIWVQIDNFDLQRITSGLDVLNVRWAKASAGLGWPAPWDGSVRDAPGGMGPLMGDTVAAAFPIPKLDGNTFVIAGPIPWTAPDPSLYSIGDGHFCLLARIVTPNLAGLGMTAPEGSDLGANTRNNARSGWHNLHIINPLTHMITHRAGVIAANYTSAPMTARLTFELLDSTGTLVPNPPGAITIDATGASRAALSHTSLAPVWTASGPVTLPSIAAGIEGLVLAPRERVNFIAAYVPIRRGVVAEAAGTDGYVMRISQWDLASGTPVQVGGQSFISGTVAGYPVNPTPPSTGPVPRPPRPRFPRWLWWLLALFLLSRCVG